MSNASEPYLAVRRTRSGGRSSKSEAFQKMRPLGKVVSRILCLNANLSRTWVAPCLKRGMPRPDLDPYGRRHHSPCTARGLPAIRTLPYGPVRSPCGHRTAFHVLAVALYGLCGTFRTRRLCIGHRAADVICRAFQAVSGLSSPGFPGVRVPLSERAGALYGKGAIWQIGSLHTGYR